MVKWFHDNDATPIYQFLAEMKTRTVSDKWKDIILLDKEPNTDDINVWIQIFRKLKFKFVTIAMSGRYTCLVESIQSQASKTEKMVVYGKCEPLFFTLKCFDLNVFKILEMKKLFK